MPGNVLHRCCIVLNLLTCRVVAIQPSKRDIEQALRLLATAATRILALGSIGQQQAVHILKMTAHLCMHPALALRAQQSVDAMGLLTTLLSALGHTEGMLTSPVSRAASLQQNITTTLETPAGENYQVIYGLPLYERNARMAQLLLTSARKMSAACFRKVQNDGMHVCSMSSVLIQLF